MASAENPSESEPIDVEFTPADQSETSSKTTASSSGPGWIGLISAGVLAALGGGAIGVVASGTDGRYAQAAEVAVDISLLEDADRTMTTRIDNVQEQMRTLNVRLEDVASREAELEETQGEALAALREDIAFLNARYTSLLGVSEDTSVDGEAVAAAEDGAEAPAGLETDGEATPLPRPEISLAALMDRLNAIEALDPTGEATPQELARTVASLQERTSQLEAVDQQFADVMEARDEALRELAQQIGALETELSAVDERVTGAAETDAERQQAIADITGDLNALREVVNERINSVEAAQLNEDEQALVRRADRVLALSSLDAAVQDGGPFGTELEALAIQLPANASVSTLRRLSEQGAPSIEVLRRRLEDLKPQVAQAGIPEPPSGEWAWLGDLLSGVVTMREEGSASGETATRRMDVALELLEENDLPAALREIRMVEGPQGEALAGWLADAQRRAQINQLMNRLRRDVMDGGSAQ